MLSPAKRLALVNAVILAVRPHGMLAETVLEPLQILRDDLAADKPAKPARGGKKAAAKDGAADSDDAPDDLDDEFDASEAAEE
jgi:hypothetical protein